MINTCFYRKLCIVVLVDSREEGPLVARLPYCYYLRRRCYLVRFDAFCRVLDDLLVLNS